MSETKKVSGEIKMDTAQDIEAFAPPRAPMAMPRQKLDSPTPTGFLAGFFANFLALGAFLTRREQ